MGPLLKEPRSGAKIVLRPDRPSFTRCGVLGLRASRRFPSRAALNAWVGLLMTAKKRAAMAMRGEGCEGHGALLYEEREQAARVEAIESIPWTARSV